jgi:biopolymer transport protein ExbD
MSHGSSERAEPNMTPLLDLVLQLIMFFMLCANFVMEQTNATIVLPEAIAAKALDKEDRPIFLNINKEGKVLISKLDAVGYNFGKEEIENEGQVKLYMDKRFREESAAGGNQPKSVVVLRADKSTPFEKVYKVMKAVRLSGYDQVKMRVIRYSGQE